MSHRIQQPNGNLIGFDSCDDESIVFTKSKFTKGVSTATSVGFVVQQMQTKTFCIACRQVLRRTEHSNQLWKKIGGCKQVGGLGWVVMPCALHQSN